MNRGATNPILMQGIGAQVTAADPAGSVWVSANAGTGKTRVLVDRISRLLLAGIPAHKILCLTFTKAAAAEMANRLNVRLGLHFLGRLVKSYRGRVDLALSYYNGGSRVGVWPNARVLPATANYVSKVRKLQRHYRTRLAQGRRI